MRFSILFAAASAAALLAPLSASAEDAKVYTWKAFGGDGASASVMVVDKKEADDPEAHYKFFLSCMAAEPWMMNISDIDAKELGKTISDGGRPTFSLMLDGKAAGGDDGGYTPDVVYNQMDKVWEYSTNWELPLLDTVSTAKEIAVKGTGIDIKLPTDGMKEALTQFKTDCEALQATTDEGEVDVPPDEPPGDGDAPADDSTKTP
jgi:hypothetical protein